MVSKTSLSALNVQCLYIVSRNGKSFILSFADSDSEGSDITLKEMSLESVIEEGDGDEKSNQTSANRWQKGTILKQQLKRFQ